MKEGRWIHGSVKEPSGKNQSINTVIENPGQDLLHTQLLYTGSASPSRGCRVSKPERFYHASLIFSQMKRLQTEGTINIQNTIGTEGSVYLTIPKNGTGQVQIIVQGSLKIFDAISKKKNVIATGEKIQVVGVASGNTLVVEKTK